MVSTRSIYGCAVHRNNFDIPHPLANKLAPYRASFSDDFNSTVQGMQLIRGRDRLSGVAGVYAVSEKWKVASIRILVLQYPFKGKFEVYPSY
jgi:hypothetical protein